MRRYIRRTMEETVTRGQSQKLHCSMKESARLQITEQQEQWDIRQVPIQRNISNKTVPFVLFSPRS